MFSSAGFLVVVLLTLLIFAVPVTRKYQYTLVLLVAGAALTSVWAIGVLAGSAPQKEVEIFTPQNGVAIVFVVDRLSALFITVINIIILTGFIYARGYLAPYVARKTTLRFSIHYFSWLWLWLSMLMVVMIREGLPFLIVWEIMALASFFLVIFDAEERHTLKTGINYLIQMHVGMFFLLIAFLLVQNGTGRMSFDALGDYFATHRNLPLFLFFFTGFAIKAGFIPLHTWLPEAHPAAPSHVSGVMSGVMIKMGIYGIIRVLSTMQSDLMTVGIILIIISMVSGVWGIMMAIVQTDLKKLLAYSSIENIGIIGLGLGLGVTGQATGNSALALLGYAGGLLHLVNHSLFKSLLFFNAGSVYLATDTRNMNRLGGVMKRMPWTSLLFLTGSLAICGLPPFNGFVSEYLIYMGMFGSLSGATLHHSILMIGSVAALSLIGGLAVFGFTRAFGMVFLGEPRSEVARECREVDPVMLIPQLAAVALIMFIGLGSALVARPLFGIVQEVWLLGSQPMVSAAWLSNLTQISIAGGIFIVFLASLLLYRRYHLSLKSVDAGPTWGCGYGAPTARQQYTATSFASNYEQVARPLLQTGELSDRIEEMEIFPGRKSFASHSDDPFRRHFVEKPVNRILRALKKIAVIQTGQIRHYILYAFIFMLLVFLLTLLKIF